MATTTVNLKMQIKIQRWLSLLLVVLGLVLGGCGTQQAASVNSTDSSTANNDLYSCGSG
jgi:hypothetical protein